MLEQCWEFQISRLLAVFQATRLRCDVNKLLNGGLYLEHQIQCFFEIVRVAVCWISSNVRSC